MGRLKRSTVLLAWLGGFVALAAAAAGLFAIASGITTYSVPRMAVVAAVLSAYTAVVSVVLTPREDRTPLGCLLCGAPVPVLIGLATGALAYTESGDPAVAFWAFLPWCSAIWAAVLLGPLLPGIARLWPGRRGGTARVRRGGTARVRRGGTPARVSRSAGNRGRPGRH